MKRLLLSMGLMILCLGSAQGQTLPSSVSSQDSSIIKPSDDVQKAITGKADSALGINSDKSVLPRKFRKSARKAFFLSLLVPGSGEYYVGNKGYTKGFVAAEAVIWSAALFNKYKGDVWRRDYIAYAAQQAGSNPGRTDDFYYQNVYEWQYSYWYNEDQWRQAIALYPYDPAAQQAYVADKLYSAEDSWEWKNEDQWNYYKGLRIKSRNSLHWVSYSVGASLLNHMLSAINAARLAKRFNKKPIKLAGEPDWRLECYSSQPETITLTFLRNF
jgi:hypothetical protein